jgi:hypothetical protein
MELLQWNRTRIGARIGCNLSMEWVFPPVQLGLFLSVSGKRRICLPFHFPAFPFPYVSHVLPLTGATLHRGPRALVRTEDKQHAVDSRQEANAVFDVALTKLSTVRLLIYFILIHLFMR